MDKAEQLAKYADELTYEDLDGETTKAVKLRLVDAIACAFAAISEHSMAKRILPLFRNRPGAESDEAFTEVDGLHVPHRMTVTTADGVYESLIMTPKGHPGTPMPISEVEDRFRCQCRLGHDDEGDELLAWLWALDDHDSLDGLFELSDTHG